MLNRDIPTYSVEISEEKYREIGTFNINLIKKEEVFGVFKELQYGKASGADMVTPELLNSDIQNINKQTSQHHQ